MYSWCYDSDCNTGLLCLGCVNDPLIVISQLASRVSYVSRSVANLYIVAEAVEEQYELTESDPLAQLSEARHWCEELSSGCDHRITLCVSLVREMANDEGSASNSC